jgi:hypothetical protein
MRLVFLRKGLLRTRPVLLPTTGSEDSEKKFLSPGRGVLDYDKVLEVAPALNSDSRLARPYPYFPQPCTEQCRNDTVDPHSGLC